MFLSKQKINEKSAGEDLNFIELGLYISLGWCGNDFTATLSSLKNVMLMLLRAACKESRIRWPGAKGFCYQASDFCS